MLRYASVLLTLLISSTVWAEAAEVAQVAVAQVAAAQIATAEITTQAAEPAVPSIGRLLLGLLAVLALLLVCAWLIRRGGLTGQSGVIKVLAQTTVGTRERIILVQVGEQQLLLGVTPQQINLLHHLPEPLAITTTAGGHKFAEQLAQLMKGQRPS